MKSKIYTIPDSDTSPEVQGKGERGLCLILEPSDFNEHKATLLGLVKAIKMDFEKDVYLIASSSSFSISRLNEFGGLNHLILFGITPKQVGLNLEAKKYFNYNLESIALLLSDSLSSLNKDKFKKMALWQCLQQLFLSN